jgi:hypothetical protein
MIFRALVLVWIGGSLPSRPIIQETGSRLYHQLKVEPPGIWRTFAEKRRMIPPHFQPREVIAFVDFDFQFHSIPCYGAKIVP